MHRPAESAAAENQIVILTGVEDDEMVFLALEAGADGYLLKRTRPADLRAALLDVLRRRRADDQRNRAAGGGVVPANSPDARRG